MPCGPRAAGHAARAGKMEQRTYRIGEAAELLQLKTHVLRVWESEFPQLAPLRTEKGQRLYTDEHLALLRRIRQLLHEQGMTIEGARRVLEGAPPPEDIPPAAAPASGTDTAFLHHLQTELREIRRLLDKP